MRGENVRRAFNSMGVGDVLDPTAGTQLDCGLFAGGVFNAACWCLQFPGLCNTVSPSTFQAAEGIANPDLLYNQPTVGAAAPAVPAGYTSTNPSVQEAELEITAASATQLRNQQANAAAIDSDVPAPAPASTLTIPVWVWVAVAGVAAFALVGLGGGSARRYGR